MGDAIAKLLSEVTTVDDYGDLVREPVERLVYVEEKSIGQSEFYQAAAAGLRPEIKLVLSDYMDYRGEKRLKYQSAFDQVEEVYTVIRTFRKDEKLEIVCRKGID